jgi:hypothetical protein
MDNLKAEEKNKNKQPVELGNGKKMDIPLEPAEDTQACWCLDFTLVRPILDF